MIVVYGIDKEINPVKAQMSDVIHKCMMEVLGMPEGKRAHRFILLSKEDYYYPSDRSDKYTVVEINMMVGRQKETIKELIKALFAKFKQDLGIDPVDLEITIKEQPPYCWGFRGITGDEAKLNYSVNV